MTLADQLEALPVVRRVTHVTDLDDWQPANREVGIEDAGETHRIHLHVANPTNGNRLLNEMAIEIMKVVGETTLEQAAPNRMTLTIEGNHGTPQAKKSPGGSGRDDDRDG